MGTAKRKNSKILRQKTKNKIKLSKKKMVWLRSSLVLCNIRIVGATIAGPLLVTGGLAVVGFGAAGAVAGTLFATAQSVGAAGLASGITAAIAGGSATLAGATSWLATASTATSGVVGLLASPIAIFGLVLAYYTMIN